MKLNNKQKEMATLPFKITDDNILNKIKELNDNVSATIYGADINKILRISSVNKILEILLKEKLNNSSDNISKYRISYDTSKYKVKDVKSKYIDIERL